VVIDEQHRIEEVAGLYKATSATT